MNFRNLRPIVIFVLVTICHQTGHCQNSTGQGVVSDSADIKSKEPLQESMEPLYVMTNTFLGVIQPESKGNKILDAIDSTSNGVSAVSTNWQEYAVHYLGYVICAAIGVVFFITMPIIGLCFCCCRLCGKCGGGNKPMKSRHDKCLRITCTILFAIVNIMLMAGMICAFVTNELIRQQTSQDNNALMPTVVSNLQSVENFKDNTITEVRTELVDNTQREINDIITSLQQMPDRAKSNVSAVTKATGALSDARKLAIRTQQIYDSLVKYDQTRTMLISQKNTLEAAIVTFSSTASTNLNALSTCNTACQNLKTEVNTLTSADYGKLPQVTNQMAGVKTVIDGGLEGKIRIGEDELKKISTEVQNKANSEIADSEASLGVLNQQIKDNVDKFEKQLKEQVSLNSTIAQVTDYQVYVDEYGDYRFYAGIGLACILLLIVLFNLLGLAFGICGSTPNMDGGLCNRGVGANLLLAGVGFTFIFASILMLVVLILFLVGGLVHTEACRILVNTEDSALVKSIDDVISDRVLQNSSFEFKISEVLSECKVDKSLYNVLSLDNIVNLTEVLDLNNYDIKEKVNMLKKISFSLPDLNIYTTDIERALDDLKMARLDDIDFVAINTALGAPVTTPDTLLNLKIKFTSLANTLSGLQKSNLERRANDLQQMNDNELATVQTSINTLSADSSNLETLIKGNGNIGNFSTQVSNLQNSLSVAETNLRNEAANAILSFVADEANAIINSLTEYLNILANSLQNDIGRCRAVYSALDTTIIAVCESTLMPFNGFWFSIGWCLLFLIPSLIFAVKLAGLYRKYENYESRYSPKSFDDPYNMGYPYPYPYPIRNVRNNYDGKHNTGYERDDYTASRSANYRADNNHYPPSSYDPGYNQQGYGGGGGGGGGRNYPNAPSSTPPNPPHYYNHQHSNRRFDY